jgi:hypothetical protein
MTMIDKLRLDVAIPFLLIALAAPVRAPAQPGPSTADRNRVARRAASLAAELAALCPVARSEDKTALTSCRSRVYRSARLRKALPPHLLWGRQADPRKSLKEQTLTQFAPDVWLGLYVPLFMFSGKHTVEYVERERLFQIRLEAAFRNRLPLGQFPYPFWHDPKKWNAYQSARTLILWVDPDTATLTAAQYTPIGKNRRLVDSQPIAPPRFDGRWMWTDRAGRLQPRATLFDGIYSERNPYKGRLEVAYRELARELRAGQCSSCHVPNNPHRMKRLVLLQTPAHAAGEIGRVLKSVREQRMPLDKFGEPKRLAPAIRAALLDSGAKFAALVDAARKWERENTRPRPR